MMYLNTRLLVYSVTKEIATFGNASATSGHNQKSRTKSRVQKSRVTFAMCTVFTIQLHGKSCARLLEIPKVVALRDFCI
jgi:hypothetical protein